MEKGSIPINLSFSFLASSLFILGCGHAHDFGYREKNAYLDLAQLFYYEHGALPKTEHDLNPYNSLLAPAYRLHAGDRITIGTRPLTAKDTQFKKIWDSSGCKTLMVMLVLENQQGGERVQWGGIRDCFEKGHFWGILTLSTDSAIPVTYYDDQMNWACYASWTAAELLKSKDRSVRELFRSAGSIRFSDIETLYRKLSGGGPTDPPFDSKFAPGTMVRLFKRDGQRFLKIEEPSAKSAFLFNLAKGSDQTIRTEPLTQSRNN